MPVFPPHTCWRGGYNKVIERGGPTFHISFILLSCAICPAPLLPSSTSSFPAPPNLLAIPLLHHHASHTLNALSPVVFIVGLPSHVLQVLHMGPYQHGAQLDKVTMHWVLHWQKNAELSECNSRPRSAVTVSSSTISKLETNPWEMKSLLMAFSN